MDRTHNKYIRNEAFLMIAKMAVPMMVQVVVERVKGPGYTATAAECFLYATLALMFLGLISLSNLRSAMNYLSENQT